MTSEQFRTEGHALHLKAFLDHPSGKALLEYLEDMGKPSSESRKQYGTAEDVKLQMSLNYVAMEQTFAMVKAIKDLVKMPTNKTHRTSNQDLIPEDASPELLKQRGIEIPKIELKKTPEPAATSVN